MIFEGDFLYRTYSEKAFLKHLRIMFRGKLKILTLALALLLMTAASSTALAQGTRAKSKAAPKSPKPAGETVIVSRSDDAATTGSAAGRTGTQDELTRATEVYKSTLRDLLVLRERKVTEAAEQLEKLRELYKDGIISRREFEETEKALTELKGQVAEVHQKLRAADQMLAEALLENEAANAPVALAAPASGNSSVKRVAYIRYAGSGNWSLSEAAKIEGFFYARTGRHLPVSAYGQSELHNRWGYDHRNAMDVAVHPDSAEGQALLAYLTSQRIPFQAFRQAVSGSATGPHIHIGRPSSKSTEKTGWVQQ
jgi:hypothetical protein